MLLPLNPEQLKGAEILLFKISQLAITDSKALTKLVSVNDSTTGLMVSNGRIGSEIDDHFRVPILPPDHVAKLLALQCHERGHIGVNGTMVKLRSRAWVLRDRKIVKAIVYKCVICRKIRKHHLSQIMPDIPDFRVKPNPPFTYSAVDFFGSIMVRGEVNKRTRGKVWGCV